ncbi:MAG: IMPACT family protein [Oscillospiraceae bacterium]|jgi:uncharacterized YigZ family protein|nr:IMPACT family protein [Oscillospiraceae bacterium]
MIVSYNTPKTQACASFTEKKSEFTGYIKPVANEHEALAFLEEIRAANRKANHNCYAYVLRSMSRHSDDGEPSGTAGAPILDVLTKEGLTDVICVVVRYFGGIMLGGGGLVRAYSKAASLAVDKAGIREMSVAQKLRVTLEYPLYSKVVQKKKKKGLHVESRDFGENITLTLVVLEEIAEKFTADLTEACSGAIVVDFIQRECFDFG